MPQGTEHIGNWSDERLQHDRALYESLGGPELDRGYIPYFTYYEPHEDGVHQTAVFVLDRGQDRRPSIDNIVKLAVPLAEDEIRQIIVAASDDRMPLDPAFAARMFKLLAERETASRVIDEWRIMRRDLGKAAFREYWRWMRSSQQAPLVATEGTDSAADFEHGEVLSKVGSSQA